MNLNGKIIVVTGAGSGIGRALVEKFVAEGARQVVAVDINSGNAQQTANDYDCVAMTADVSRDEDIKRVIEETESRYRPHRPVLQQRRGRHGVERAVTRPRSGR